MRDDPVELLAYLETGFPFANALVDEFQKQFPNVTVNVREDQFSNLIAQTPLLLTSDSPPDLIRLPTMVGLVKDGLLLNLEPYVEAFGWDEWPATLLTPHRVAEGGRPRGEGDLYAGGLNYSTTGVFYNKEQAAQIGMTEPPATLEEFEGLLAAAKDAGLQPIMQWNDAASGGGLAFPLQNLMASLGPVTPINEWIYQKEGATIDTPTNLEAAQHLQQWIEAGYFPEDVNATGYTQSNARFAGGEGVFTFNGDWQNAQYDTDAPGNIGFFLFPPAVEGEAHAAMSSPVTFGIAANAKNPDCAAFFLDWVATDPDGAPDQRQRSAAPIPAARLTCRCRRWPKVRSSMRRSQPRRSWRRRMGSWISSPTRPVTSSPVRAVGHRNSRISWVASRHRKGCSRPSRPRTRKTWPSDAPRCPVV